MTYADPTAHWTSRLTELAVATEVRGATLGIWTDHYSDVIAHGVLSTATKVPVTPDSVFQIGSITKPWTGTMIMQLVQEGRLSLDTTVAEVLPGVRIAADDVASQVTIRHLLNHSSGIDGDIFTDTGRGGGCLERYVEILADVGRTHPVGAAFSYCNSGFVVLGRIIEVLDGREWDQSLRKRLIEPLRLSQTVTLPEEAILHRAAVGHRDWPRVDEAVSTWMLARSLGPAGLIVASAGDLLTFARMHLNNGVTADGTALISAEMAASMLVPTVQIPGIGAVAGEMGLSWRLDDWGGHLVFGHDGGTVGQNAYLRIDPQSRVIACLLTNASDARALYRKLFSEVFDEYAGVTVPAVPQPITGPVRGDLARHAGRYERPSHRMDLSLADGRLRAVAEVTGALALTAEAEPQEFELHPADDSGDNFVVRSHESKPWTNLSFGKLADGTPYLFSGGRITQKLS